MRVLITSKAYGTVDYTRHVLDGTLTIEDSINVPTLISFELSPADNSFVIPKRSSYVQIVSDILAPVTGYGSGKVIATGFITTEPERTFLGITQNRGPYKFAQYSYSIKVTSDEWLLNCNTVPFIPAFVNQTDSQILASLAQALMPGFFDTSQMGTGTIVPYYAYDPAQTWSDIAKTFADQNRYHYKVLNKQIIYQPFGDATLGITYDEQNQKESQLFPLELKTGVITIPPVNDCTVLGDTEPQTNWDNYFVGDGFTSNFQLKHQVFQGTSSNLLQDDWTESSFTQGTWVKNDPLNVLVLVDGNGNALGALNVVQKGQTGVYLPQVNATYLQAQNGLELGGGVNLQHGQFTFNDTAVSGGGIVGGIYPSSVFIPGNVLAGFAITGQDPQGPYNVFQVQGYANSNQLILSISGANNLQPGNVIQASNFVGASFANGNKYWVVGITTQVQNGVTVYLVQVQGLTTYANAYGPANDSGKVTVVQNDVLVTASGAAGLIVQPVFSGALVGPRVISQPNHQYVLQTWIGAGAPTRFTRPYTNLTRTSTYGAQNLAASGSVTWVVTDVNLGNYVIQQQNPLFGLFPAAPAPIVTKYTQTNVGLPPFALYCLLNGIDLNVSINYTNISEPPQGFLTVQSLTGASGGNLPWLPAQLSVPIVYQLGFGMINQSAQISAQGEAFELSFYTDDIPSVGARIRFQSWSAGQSVARVQDLIAIANEASITGDNGIRAAIMTNLSPLPRTSDECEAAAGAAILDREYPQFQGTYTIECAPGRYEQLFAPSLYQFPRTGRYLYINAPSRGITGQNFFANTVRFQVIELRSEIMVISVDYGPDLYLEKLLPAFLEREQNILTPTQTVKPPNPITLPQVLNAHLPTLDNAKVTLISNSLTGNYIQVDLGAPPVTACEVRYVDNGFGVANQGRIGLFTTQVFTLPRTSRDQTWYLRSLNGALFSRFSKALRVVYPLVPSAPALVSNNASTIVANYAGDVRDIYGIELRALAASGITGQFLIALPNSNPVQNVYAFVRQQTPGVVQPNALQLVSTIGTTSYSLRPADDVTVWQQGDIVYFACPTDSSFVGFRILNNIQIFSTVNNLQSIDYGPPYPDTIGTGIAGSPVGTVQLVSRNGFALVVSGSLVGGVATIVTSTPHNLGVGQNFCIGACYAAQPSFIAPYNPPLQNGSVFCGTATILSVPSSTSFTYLLNVAGGVNNVPLNGLVGGFAPGLVLPLFLPGANPGTLMQRPVFSPSDLVIDLTQPDIAQQLSILESLTPGSRVGGLGMYFFNLTWDYSAPTLIPSFTVPSISGLVVNINSQNLTWGLASGSPDGHRVETMDITSGAVLTKYTVDHPSNPQLLKQSPLPAADWLNPRLIKVTPFDGLGDGIPSLIFWGGSSGTPVIGGGAGFPTAQVGDTVRFNTKGDGLWDAVNFAGRIHMFFYDAGVGSLYSIIGSSNAPNVLGSTAHVSPTYSDNGAVKLSAVATASTSTVIGNYSEGNANFGAFGIGSFYRWSHRFAVGNLTNARYWMGLGVFNNGGIGNNGATLTGTPAYATDTPNKSTVGFRFSAGVDTTWQAVCVTAGAGAGTQTVVDTLVAVDTNPHTFEMATTGTVVTFFIDGNQVAQISTNVPSGLLGGDSRAEMFWSGDNKNTATAISGTHYWMALSPK